MLDYRAITKGIWHSLFDEKLTLHQRCEACGSLRRAFGGGTASPAGPTVREHRNVATLFAL
jgi:hypothetical protein